MIKIRSLLNGYFLLFLLSGLYPAVFLASKNWFIYTDTQLKVLLFFTPAISLAAGLVYSRLCYPIIKIVRTLLFPRKIAISEKTIGRSLQMLFCCLVFVCLLKSTIFEHAGYSLWMIAILIAVIVCIILFVGKNGFFVPNLILLVMIALSSLSWFYSYHKSLNEADFSGDTVNRDLYNKISFVKKPNVYLIHLESYHNQEAMVKIYGFENQDFINELKKREFTIYPNHFSNYWYTLSSLTAIFSMQHHHYKFEAGNMDMLRARAMIGGNTYNPVLHVFRNNGYKCQIIQDIPWLFIQGNSWEYTYPKREICEVFNIYQIDRLYDIFDRLRDSFIGKAQNMDLDSVMKERILIASKSAEPYFSFLAPRGLGHTNKNQTWTELDSWEKKYPVMVKRANQSFLNLFDFIIENDPEGIIVLYGDHGAAKYRGVWEGKEELNRILENRGVSGDTLALDLFSTLLAIRYPGSDDEKFYGVSHVNIFRTLFSALSEDNNIMNTRVTDDSYFLHNKTLYVGVRGGKPLASWEVAIKNCKF